MNAWTPGPWEVVRDNVTGEPLSFGGNLKVCNLREAEYVMVNNAGKRERQIANARLIALSPEWPDVLRQCVKMLDDCCQYALDLGPINRAKLESARALLARLEGGAS